MKRFIAFVSFILAVISYSPAQENKPPGTNIKTIFILHSYNQSLKWQQDQEAGYSPYLYDENNELVIEYLDSKRYHLNEVRENLFLEKFNKLYSEKKFDLIFLTDNASLRFINKNYQKLPFLANTPIIANGINHFDSSLVSNIPDIKIIHEEIRADKTILQMLQFFPDLERIYIINDFSPTGISWKADIIEQILKIQDVSKDIRIIHNKNVPFKMLMNEIRTLPPKSAILIGNYFTDKNYAYISNNIFLSFLRKNTEHPIFCLSDYYMDSTTVIGGMVTSGVGQGRQLGIEATLILDPDKKITAQDTADIRPFWLFNYHALQKHNLLGKPLPKNATVLHSPQKFFSQHKTLFVILLLGGIIGLISLLIFIYLNYSLRKKVSHRTDKINDLIFKFEQFLKEMPIGYVEFDTNTKITAWNKSSERIFGYTEKEALGEKIVSLIVEKNDQTKVRDLLHKLLEGGVGYFSLNSNVTKNGDVLLCEWYNTPLRDKKGKIYCFMATVVDVTEKERLKKEVEFMIEELKKLILQKDKFIASSMHDLKNLMTPILCYSELINMENLNPEKIKGMAEQINKSSSILLELMNKVMNISRVQSGLMKHEPRKIKIQNVVNEMFSALELNHVQKNITVVNNIDSDVIVMADYEMVGSIFLNLLGNAIKFTPQNGTISVSGKIIGKNFEIQVKDSGIGLDIEKFNSLINHNVSFSSKGTAGESGTGLGLLLCNELVEKNHGTFRAEINPEGGTSFFFTLPLATE